MINKSGYLKIALSRDVAACYDKQVRSLHSSDITFTTNLKNKLAILLYSIDTIAAGTRQTERTWDKLTKCHRYPDQMRLNTGRWTANGVWSYRVWGSCSNERNKAILTWPKKRHRPSLKCGTLTQIGPLNPKCHANIHFSFSYTDKNDTRYVKWKQTHTIL